MNRLFKNFAISWLVGVIMFITIVLTVRLALLRVHYDATFYVSLVFVMLAFLGQLAVGYKFFTEENKDKVFLNMPLLSLSKACVIVSVIVCGALMMIPNFDPFGPFLAILAAVIVLGLFAFALIRADAAATAVTQIGEKVAADTMFLKNMTTASEGLIARARTDAAKETATKVYEALRYSTKMSRADLNGVEAKISSAFSVFADAVAAGDDELTKTVGGQLLSLIAERDSMAKSSH